MNRSVINSADYWDSRFAEDWEAMGGIEQSRYFSGLALQHLPSWLKTVHRLENMSVCDWGCAQGDGTDVLSGLFGVDQTVGVDFSETAVAQARARYPHLTFKAENWLDEGSPVDQYDIVFSSNTLEHFHDPFGTLESVIKRARKLVVLALPYREINRIDEHHFTFSPDNLPAILPGDWVPLFCRAVDCSDNTPCFWPGEQVFLVYGRLDWVQGARMVLGDLSLDANNAERSGAPLQHDSHQSLQEAIKVVQDEQKLRSAEHAAADARLAQQVETLQAEVNGMRAELAQRTVDAKEVDKIIAQLRHNGHLPDENEPTSGGVPLPGSRAALEYKIEALRLDLDGKAQALSQKALETEQMAGVIAQLRLQYQEREQQFLRSTSWRITRPLRAVGRGASRKGMTVLIRRTYSLLPPAARLQLARLPLAQRAKAWLNRSRNVTLANYQPVMPDNLPSLVPSALPDVIVWGVIDWHFRIQRPQQLARGFARAGHRVFYVSSELVDTPNPGFSVERIENEAGTVFQLHMHVAGGVPIYGALPRPAANAQLRASMALLTRWLGHSETISVVQHPYWASSAFALPRNQVVYDCMDHHEGFGTTANEMIRAEHQLMERADLVVVTSDWLFNIVQPRNANVNIVRNACEFEHFRTRPSDVYHDPADRKVIGYYGAIAEWFDLELVRAVAQAYPQHSILLIGADTTNAAGALADLPNVSFTGEVPYAHLPRYLYGFDVCMLPFRVIDLTLATNPVKAYEYLCSGKPVVSVDLPEMKQFGDLVYTAQGQEAFIEACAQALAEVDPQRAEQRVEFAARQTWVHRAHEFQSALQATVKPRVSVIVVTYNNLDLTRKCLESVEKWTLDVDFEIVIVDNNSADQSPEWLTAYASTRPFVKLQLNPDNLGFSAANNQGLAMATGDYLVILNNDTVVSPGWATGLIRHLRADSTIGLIGPVTNNIGNEAKVPVTYASLDQMPAAAASYTVNHMGEAFDIYTLAFFCVMLTRRVYEEVGGLDEAFGIGFYEDDDYCRRVQQANLRCVCAEDVFVHHNLSASFNKMAHEKRAALMEKNKKIYEAKWGKWVPHNYRQG